MQKQAWTDGGKIDATYTFRAADLNRQVTRERSCQTPKVWQKMLACHHRLLLGSRRKLLMDFQTLTLVKPLKKTLLLAKKHRRSLHQPKQLHCYNLYKETLRCKAK
ncbi:hypothetical protein MLD38_032914 [Melastoma candidum]|uniref:Uncharacterized protein n=1 Tax=Melastoma candidum TaxID=119954 RepID=A0ACB9M9D9_9MYRT|nr:hypothetical protein MLD38_032914 [Melastoma candidum]